VSLLDALRAGVGVANTVTRPLQGLVKYQREIGQDKYGPTYAPAVYLHAIIDYKAAMVRTRAGVLTATRSTITLLDINEVVAATNGMGFGNNDVFTLPDGDTGPTLDLSGFIDAGTGNPIATTVMMG
jgi:hypothetical protein